ncbi:hypothetical protein, partial [Halobacterium salinarum]|uniref:hypothetical protein n=1 Tax=Halobacterium salinarum TaxID=2242 RepID=UPI001F2CC3B3
DRELTRKREGAFSTHREYGSRPGILSKYNTYSVKNLGDPAVFYPSRQFYDNRVTSDQQGSGDTISESTDNLQSPYGL